jgi:hypothetical protein
MRQPLKDHEAGAHMYAPFMGHIKGALASAVPFVIIYFLAQPMDEAMSFLAYGGFTVVPVLLTLYCCGWAAMSVGLLAALRTNQSVRIHYLVYAAAGAIALPLLTIALLALVREATLGSAAFWEASTFGMLMLVTPPLGALGTVIGRRVLAPSIQWNRWLERAPLPPALEFVEGKRDKDEFRKM